MPMLSTRFGLAVVLLAASSSRGAAMCTRLPLSDVAVSEIEATAAARLKLGEYAADELKSRGWNGKGKLSVSREEVSCEPYVNLGLIAAGFRCRVTATFCTSERKQRSAAIGRTIRLRLKGSLFEISGVLKKIDKGSYIIVPPDSGSITIAAKRFDCISEICPEKAD